MKRPAVRLLGCGWLMAFAASGAPAVERFPPPDFESGHTLPSPTTAAPDPAWHAPVDVAVLVIGLALAAYLVLRRRSRAGVVALSIGALAYFGFWRGGCVCPIGAVQNVSLALGDSSYAVPVVVALFFALPLLAALLVGRVFCAGVCPLGAIQDLVVVRPVRVPEWLETPLRTIRPIYLGLAVLLAATGSTFILCRFDPFVGLFRLSGSLGMLIFGGALLAIGMFIARPYCRYLCPYGLVLGWLGRTSKWHARLDPQTCINCRLCEEACPVNAIDKPTEPPVDADRRAARRRLTIALAMAPLWLIAGTGLGYALAGPLSRAHREVQLAELLRAEQAGTRAEPTDQTTAFRATGAPLDEAYDRAAAVRSDFTLGAPIYGGFVGLAFAASWIRLARPERRDDYRINRARCVSCGRCLKYCPHDPRNRERLAQLTAEGKVPS